MNISVTVLDVRLVRNRGSLVAFARVRIDPIGIEVGAIKVFRDRITLPTKHFGDELEPAVRVPESLMHTISEACRAEVHRLSERAAEIF